MRDWRRIEADQEVADFLTMFGSFHDSCLKEAYAWGGHSVESDLMMTVNPMVYLRVLFQRQARDPSAVELVFVDVTELLWKPAQPPYEDIIYEASIFRQGGLFVWTDGRDHQEQRMRIAARHLFWRDASAWMGADHRIGAPLDLSQL